MVAGTLPCLLLLIVSVLVGANADGYTLIAMKKKWQAPLPTWIEGTEPCGNWEGVTCDHEGRVLALNLTNKGLKGLIPSEIRGLVFLRSLDLSNHNGSSDPWNQIEGDVSVIGRLSNLQMLNLSYNVLNTEFPPALLQLTNLTALILSNSHLIGRFPVGLSKLQNLQYLYLSNCTMTGDLPAELGALINLMELSLWNNQFNSKIPVELGNLVHLTYLNLHSCGLWGGLPPEFHNLKNMHRLYLYNNVLTGTIPESWSAMENLSDLRLEYNFLTGNFPSWTLHHTNLHYLELAYNQFYGSIPTLNSTQLQTLRIECDFFTGDLPIEQPKMILIDEGNCFSNINTSDDDSKYTCNRDSTCNGFFQKLTGGCPPCPSNQTFDNLQLCLCGEINAAQSRLQKTFMIVGSIFTAFSFLFLVFLAFKKWMLCGKNSISGQGSFYSTRESDDFWEVPQGVKLFSWQELANATGNFHKDYEIGAGGFGKVYYGMLDSGKKVAIKCASSSSIHGSAEFRNEVLLLSRLHHRNLVHLEGFCDNAGFQILVYEYMANGSLHSWLFSMNTSHELDWYKRLDIAVGVAQGLEYLHTYADPPVIHRDVKSSNILLDENLVAKLSDFGLSKATLEFETHISTTPAGTSGYIDPEYFLRGQLTTASDVYAFGMVLLELVTGQKAIDHGRIDDENLVEWVRSRSSIEGIKGIIDPNLSIFYPEQVYHEVTQLALNCTSYRKEGRPTMKEVVTILESNIHKVYPYATEFMHHSNGGTKHMHTGMIKYDHTNDIPCNFQEASSYSQISIIEPR
eukprot:c25514_g1_i2 orf=375-2756(-)